MQTTTVMPIAVSLDQAAHLIGVSRSTIERLVSTGRLNSARVGRRVLIRRVDVEGVTMRTRVRPPVATDE